MNEEQQKQNDSWLMRLDSLRHLAANAAEEYQQELDEYQEQYGESARELYEEKYL